MRAFGVIDAFVNGELFVLLYVTMKVMYYFVPLNKNGDVKVGMQEKFILSIF